MKLRGHTLGTPCRALIAACVGRIPAKALFDYLVNHHDWAFKGFQPKLSNLPHARKRFCDGIKTDQLVTLSDQLHDYLYNATTVAWACVFSEQALRDHWQSWVKFLGVDIVLGGMLFDPRDAVFHLAMDALDDEAFSMAAFDRTDASVAEAALALQTDFEPLLGLIQPLTEPRSSSANFTSHPKSDLPSTQQVSTGHPPISKASLNALEAKLSESEKALRKLKGERVTEQQEFAKLKRNQAALQNDLSRLTIQSVAHEATIAELNDALATANQGVDLRVKLEVRNHLASSLRPWIEPLVAVDRALQGPSSDLLARTDQVLADQAQQDQAFGHREALRARIAALESARSKLRDARLHAIKPLAELASLEADIDHELARLQRVLQTATKPTSKDPVLSQLEVSLNAQQSFEGLAALRRFIRACVAQGLVKKADAARLDHQARQQALRLNDLVLIDPAYVQTNAIIEGEPPSPETLAQALALGLAHRILLDGYNLIFDALGYNASLGPSRAGSKPQRSMAEEGRLALIDQVKASIAHHPLIEVRIFLDSPHASDERINNQLSLHYSGGSGANRADRDIAAYLDYLKQRNDTVPTTVISKDWEVQQNAQSHHIHTLRPDHFWALF